MVTKTVLDSGVRVISENIPHCHSISIGIWVASGTRREDPRHNGVAHFIEHLLFKGTRARSSLDIAREIDSIGGVMNAFTGREYVCYYVKVLAEYLPQAVDLLTDIFVDSIFDPDEIERERKVILQEISMLEDAPDDQIHDLFYHNFWLDHPLGMSILGTDESVRGLTRDVIIDHRDRSYRAEDVIICAAGQVDHVDLLKQFERLCSRISPGNQSDGEAAVSAGKRVICIEKDLEQVHLCIGIPALPQSHERRYDAHILNTILGGGMSSRLFQKVREERGLAYSIYSYLACHSDTGSLVMYAGTGQDQIDEVLEVTLQELASLKETPVSSVELDAARKQLKGNILLSLESSDNRMSKLAKNEIYFGGYQPVEEIMAGFDRVTSESLSGLCAELLNDRSVTLVLLGRGGSAISTDSLLF